MKFPWQTTTSYNGKGGVNAALVSAGGGGATTTITTVSATANYGVEKANNPDEVHSYIQGSTEQFKTLTHNPKS